MPFIVRATEQSATQTSDGIEKTTVLTPSQVGGGRLAMDHFRLDADCDLTVKAPANGLAWIQVLEGAGTLAGQTVTGDFMTMLPSGFSDQFCASENASVLITQIPDARSFDDAFSARSLQLRSFDWTNEPVLRSKHDGRQRIYLATRTLFGTTACRGEMIIYPPGTAAPEHHHEGAEHYQYILSGSGTAVLDGRHEILNTGDLLYNFEDEPHWFFNHTDDDFVFVEMFVPGACKTVWAPGAEVCEWLPTGVDIHGRPPSRHIGSHVHGEGSGI